MEIVVVDDGSTDSTLWFVRLGLVLWGRVERLKWKPWLTVKSKILQVFCSITDWDSQAFRSSAEVVFADACDLALGLHLTAKC
jgi:hypothetical protein